ncbi:MAG: hypothetical protein ABEK36_05295 [Candidatus Aenigmatarchaeota archaeon]
MVLKYFEKFVYFLEGVFSLSFDSSIYDYKEVSDDNNITLLTRNDLKELNKLFDIFFGSFILMVISSRLNEDLFIRFFELTFHFIMVILFIYLFLSLIYNYFKRKPKNI